MSIKKDTHIERPEKFNERGLAVIECPEKIPCNPCVTSCKFGAVTKEKITSLPKVDYSKCTGCTTCVSACPGLAIFVISVVGDKAYVTLPYEFLPLPKKGDVVNGLDRDGNRVCDAKVTKVLTKGRDRTATITLEVDKDLAMIVRNLRAAKQ
jgi:Fe-S-cluster-containing hydrogenase component 2